MVANIIDLKTINKEEETDDNKEVLKPKLIID